MIMLTLIIVILFQESEFHKVLFWVAIGVLQVRNETKGTTIE